MGHISTGHNRQTWKSYLNNILFLHIMDLKSHILPRLYQQTIISSCISNNSLVVLPTGLGKTIIAIMGIAHYLTYRLASLLSMI